MSLILVIRNVGPTPLQDNPEVCSYVWEARINQRRIAQGHVTLHPRAEGWAALVLRAIANHAAEEQYRMMKGGCG